MSNIPTAQYVLDNSFLGGKDINQGVIDAMIEFAQMHVQECKLQIIEQFSIPAYKDVIINTYPLTNIK